MHEVEVALGRLDERVHNLEGWQKTQNGTLQRLEERMDRIEARLNYMGWGIATTLGGVLVDILLRMGGLK